MGFFKKQREKQPSNLDYSDISFNGHEESSNNDSNNSTFKMLNLQKNLESNILQNWKYNTLMIKGNSGTGKATTTFAAALDLDFEVK